MARTINETKDLNIIPASYSGADSFGGNASNNDNYSQNTDNGVNPSDNTSSYARFSPQTTEYSAYYIFDITTIPQSATINSVTAIVRAYKSTTNITATVALCNDTTIKGSAVTISSTTSPGTLYEITGSSWTRAELNKIKLRFTFKRSGYSSAYLYFYGCNLTINYTYNGIEYDIVTTKDTDLVGSISPNGTTVVNPDTYGNEYVLLISGDTLTDILVTDNNTNINDQLVQHEAIPGSFTIDKPAANATMTGQAFTQSGSNFVETTIYQNAIGVLASTSTNTTSNMFHRSSQAFDTYIDYGFDFSDIPQNAKITSVSCSVKGHAELDSGSTSVCNVRMYSGNNPKSESIEFTSSSNTVVTFQYPGSWTGQELQKAILRFTFGVSGGYIVGITWTVNYIVEADYPYYWTYTINPVNNDHNIIVGDTFVGQRYIVETLVYVPNVTVSNTYREVKENNSYDVTIYAQDLSVIIVSDNGTNVNSQLVGSNGVYTYSIAHVNQYHSIRIMEQTFYEITAESLENSVTVQVSETKVYEGNSFIITVNTSSISNLYIKDNDVDISSQFSRTGTNIYTATITNVQDDHEIIVVARDSHIITAVSNSENITLSPNGYISILEGYSQTFTINTSISKSNIILKDNNTDVSELIQTSGNNYTYTISNIQSTHTLVVYELFIPPVEDPEIVYHNITISTINAETTPENGTVRLQENDSQTITITPIESHITLCTDNGVDITNSLTKHGTEPTYTVTNRGTYYFIKNNTSGFYTSNNNGVSNSAAVSRVTFSLPVDCLIEIEYINYAQAGYDYGIFGKTDISLGTTYIADSTSNVYKSCSSSSDNTPNIQTLTYEMSAGSHYIDIKYIKNNRTNSNNDNLQWRIKKIQPITPCVYYTYDINNIDADHSLIFIFGDVVYYTILSSGTRSKLYPTGAMVQLPGDNYTLTIIPDKPNYKVSIEDNGRDRTKELERNETTINDELIVNYIYKLNKVSQDHILTIEVIPAEMLYMKILGKFIGIDNVYRKNNIWEITELSSLTDAEIYFHNQ